MAGWIRYCVRWVCAAGGPGPLRAPRPGWPLLAVGSGAVSGVAGAAGGPGLLRACRPGWPLQAVGSGAVSGVAGAVGGCGPPRSRRRGWPLLAGWIRYCVRWVGAAGSSVQLRAGALGGHCWRGDQVLHQLGRCSRWPRAVASRRPGWPSTGWGSVHQVAAGLRGPAGGVYQVMHPAGLCFRWPQATASSTPWVATAGWVIRCCASWVGVAGGPGQLRAGTQGATAGG